MSKYHTTVLLQEAVDALEVKQGQKYIDATLGGGGHTKLILEHRGEVLGIDVDQEALKYVEEELRSKRLHVVRGNFAHIAEIAKENGFDHVAGILFDFGVSGHQLETAERGFSFLHDAPLDMRMDKDLSVSATELVNGLNQAELTELFEKLGEEWRGKKIAQAILAARKIKPIETTTELSDIIRDVYKTREKIHPATKVFQALRIAVNDELGSIRDALPKALELLGPGGRLVTITFHSLEDRIVKETFREFENTGKGKNVFKN